jgi:predicted nucleic acid-binding protein
VALTVVLDTCVLYPAHLRDTLLRLAERELFTPLWSADIIDELTRNLVRAAVNPSAVAHLIQQMSIAFPHSEITGYRSLLPAMTCHPKDRHVLAAAVRSGASAIVTANVGDFPDSSVGPHALRVIDPDTFLSAHLEVAPSTVIGELRTQAAANRKAPKTLPGLLDALAVAGVPKFAEAVSRQVQAKG